MLKQAYAPLVRVPCIEPASKGGRLISLLDKDDGCVPITARRVALQVLMHTVP